MKTSSKTPRSTLAIVILCAVTLVIGMSTGAAAARLITGKQIKNGTVTSADIKNKSLRTVDLSDKARASLKGAPGPAGSSGADGADGAPGPAGPAGSPGLSGLVVVTSAPVAVPGGERRAVIASCPAGMRALGVAGYFTDAGQLVQFHLPVATNLGDDAAAAYGFNSDANARNLRAEVTCANVG